MHQYFFLRTGMGFLGRWLRILWKNYSTPSWENKNWKIGISSIPNSFFFHGSKPTYGILGPHHEWESSYENWFQKKKHGINWNDHVGWLSICNRGCRIRINMDKNHRPANSLSKSVILKYKTASWRHMYTIRFGAHFSHRDEAPVKGIHMRHRLDVITIYNIKMHDLKRSICTANFPSLKD